jgi:hypothetical protein
MKYRIANVDNFFWKKFFFEREQRNEDKTDHGMSLPHRYRIQ